MLNQDLGGQKKWPQLTLKRTLRRNQLSRLLPCGSLEQKRSGMACEVFLKRTRASSNLLPGSMQKPKRRDDDTRSTRGRRGSFLRLARIPQSLSVRG